MDWQIYENLHFFIFFFSLQFLLHAAIAKLEEINEKLYLAKSKKQNE